MPPTIPHKEELREAYDLIGQSLQLRESITTARSVGGSTDSTYKAIEANNLRSRDLLIAAGQAELAVIRDNERKHEVLGEMLGIAKTRQRG